MSETKKHYPTVNPNPDFASLEKEVLARWASEKTFEKSVEKPAGGEFVFYDGPPFANGLPHYGHLLTGFVKDVFARYQTMQGRRVERRFGWDCHGLPAEMGSEKELGISGRAAITNYGIDKFNEHCRTSVMKYTSEWEDYVTRQARWVDFKNDYKTMDRNFMESVLWAFKQLYDKGLVYEAHRVMPYSWAAETPLSNFETKLDNSYREREDKAITVAFELNEVPKIISKLSEELREALIESAENHIGNIPSEETKKEYLDFIEKVKKPIKLYKILAWTTTPWTLPSNLALGVNKDIDYLPISIDGVVYLASRNSLNFYKKELGLPTTMLFFNEDSKKISLEGKDSFDVLKGAFSAINRKEPTMTIGLKWCLKGSDLIGLTYKPLFPYFKDNANSFRILDGSSFVTDGDGTGIVHLAPAFGEEDQKCCEANGIELVCPVDGQGKYTDEIFDLPDLSLKGLNVIAENTVQYKFGEANERIINWLKAQGKLIKQEQIKHNYPHCWRTDTPLIYRAMPSWYVEVTKFRDRAAELNQQINWIPAHIRDGQMGHMLKTAPDWSISRNRFWGTPIPVWRSKSGKIIVIGSIAELEQLSGQKVVDLHRPYIDNIKITKDGEEYTRVEDVFDCWFESGSMPFAQVHYPFENKDWFEEHFPADFITEYVGQTRGWFNTLIMLSTALFDKIPFKNCICHGVVLDAETGLKYSKRLKNYKDPMEVINQFGADALRWLMIASPVMRGQDLMVDPDGKFIRDVVRLAIKPIWNAYNFFTLYANADNIYVSASLESKDIMDLYILAKCKYAVETIKASLDAYDTPTACEAVLQFFDILNNWYIRRSKERFWSNDKESEDKEIAYATLYIVLTTICSAAAPLLPLTLEEIYKKLTNKESVHLSGFPKLYATTQAEKEIISQMDKVRDACNSALAIRGKLNIRVRQPLQSLTVVGSGNFDGKLGEIICDEINVKTIASEIDVSKYATLKLSINSAILGKRLPAQMKQILPASKKGEWKRLENGDVEICGEVLLPSEYTLQLEPKPEYAGRAQALSSNDALVILDTTITPELEAEGLARDIVRMIQQARKDADLNVSDKIRLHIAANEKIAGAVASNQAYILEQVLAVEMLPSAPQNAKFSVKNELEGSEVVISFVVAA